MLQNHSVFFFFQAEDGIRYDLVTGVQTCALPILMECLPFVFLLADINSQKSKAGEE